MAEFQYEFKEEIRVLSESNTADGGGKWGESFKDLYKPLSETELVERIDHSLSHLNDRTAIEAEQCYRELLSEYGS